MSVSVVTGDPVTSLVCNEGSHVTGTFILWTTFGRLPRKTLWLKQPAFTAGNGTYQKGHWLSKL